MATRLDGSKHTTEIDSPMLTAFEED